MKHTIEKMAQQGNIISWVEVGNVEDLLGEKEGCVNMMVCMMCLYKMYCQEKVKNFEVKPEEVAHPMAVQSLRGLYHWPCDGPGDGKICGNTLCAMM